MSYLSAVLHEKGRDYYEEVEGLVVKIEVDLVLALSEMALIHL
jgi:hypothetical protein